MIQILVPTDFSKNADNAIKYAVALAKKEKGKIILLHAYHDTFNVLDIKGFVYTTAIKKTEKESNKKLEKICEKLIKPQNVKCEYLSQYQLGVDAILDIVKEKKIDYVIMGTKGASGLKNVILGSITAKVIEKCACPVIAIPENVIYNGIKKITFATEYNSTDLKEVQALVNIATPFKAQINLLHIANGEYTNDDEEAILKKYVKKINSKITYNNLSFQLLFGNDIQKKLQEYLDEKSTDIIAMSTTRKDLLRKLFGTSLTRHFAYYSNIPLIVFHHKKSVIFI
jgi:nucleotide-binding universal stress UspA family protein